MVRTTLLQLLVFIRERLKTLLSVCHDLTEVEGFGGFARGLGDICCNFQTPKPLKGVS